MVKITEELLRKRAEHNEGEISSLEELTLHQEDIEKIEHIQKWCKELRILYLQNNLIAKIENVYKLKKLEYLNLALNNIEKIENLDGCESLQKLDLTLNFVGDLTSINNLKLNERLQILYLNGNPCTDFEGYREYVITTLPQLTSLDGTTIERSAKIISAQMFYEVKDSLLTEENNYKGHGIRMKDRMPKKALHNKEKGRRPIGRPQTRWMDQAQKDIEAKGANWRRVAEGEVWRNRQEWKKMCQIKVVKIEVCLNQPFSWSMLSWGILRAVKALKIQRLHQKSKSKLKIEEIDEELDKNYDKMDDEKLKEFWSQTTDHSPETRIQMANFTRRHRQNGQPRADATPHHRKYRTFASDGRPLNLNEAKVPFTLTEDDTTNSIVLDVSVFRYLDTSLIDVDIHPNYAKVTIKGKVLQIVFDKEIKCGSTVVQRSQTTGHLVLTMPKVNGTVKSNFQVLKHQNIPPTTHNSQKREWLEIGSSNMDFSKIVEYKKSSTVKQTSWLKKKEKLPSKSFIENPEVPPLE
uniref:U2A'/phosphoprotein 32 family A C-terminal domain-containing protein n=1 Tax=Timema bartmani TaxID=61472 RepID=A0A7R9EMW9_9NEOP|nr:unnamed protein product [Timema bartmani]